MTDVLIVEGNEMNRDLLARRLRRKGYAVDCAANGPEGIALARAILPDIILMDVSPGGMDGWETTKILKADPRTQAIPVIALSTHALENDRRKAIDAGCADLEVKPIALSGLIEKIEMYAIRT